MHNKHLIVIVGPTAVGKTKLCIELAQYFKIAILSADSRQFYKEMSIGTAKPTIEEMKGVPHYFVNNLSIHEEYNAGKFEKDALSVLENIYQKDDFAILTGGSGLYINAVCDGIDDIPKSTEIRDQLNHVKDEEGLESLTNKLYQVDPDYYKLVDLNNPQRVIRALEVYRFTGKPYSTFLTNKAIKRDFNIVKIGLELPREELYVRINNRMDLMVEAGLFEEVKNLEPFKSYNALQTVGYKEVFDFLDGLYNKEEAIRLLKRNSRRYAKRQLTWFRKDNQIHWFQPKEINKIIEFIERNVTTPQ